MNIEAADAERNCDWAEVLVVIGRELDEKNDEVIREADVDDPDQIDYLEPKNKPGILKPEMMIAPDNERDHITGVKNDEDLEKEENINEVPGVNEETKNVKRSYRVRLRNP